MNEKPKNAAARSDTLEQVEDKCNEFKELLLAVDLFTNSNLYSDIYEALLTSYKTTRRHAGLEKSRTLLPSSGYIRSPSHV
jgi:hypothetical protein